MARFGWRPQDIANGLFASALKTGWTGARNFYRGVRGEANVKNFFTGQKETMRPGQQLAHDLKKRWHETRAGQKLERDRAGNIVPKMELDEAGQMMPVRQSRIGGLLGMASDAAVGSSAIALGWGAKAAVGAGAYVAGKSVRPLGHMAYQSFGIARDVGIAGATGLYKMSQNKAGAWALGLAPLAVLGAAESYEAADHYAVNRGLAGYQGQTLDSNWGSITDSERDLVAAGENEANQRSVTRGRGQTFDTFGTGGDLVFAMHNQR